MNSYWLLSLSKNLLALLYAPTKLLASGTGIQTTDILINKKVRAFSGNELDMILQAA